MILEHYISTELSLAVLVCIIIWLVLNLRAKKRNLPPGPWGLPLLGYFPFIPPDTHLHFAKLCDRYGPVFSFRTVGGALVIVLHDLKIIKEVILTRNGEFSGKPPENNVFEWMSDGIGISQEGPSWREQRKFFLQTAKSLGFGRNESEEIVHHELYHMMEVFKSYRGKSADLLVNISYATSNVSSMILFSKKFADNESQFNVMSEKLLDMLQIFINNKKFLVGTAFNLMMAISPMMKKAKAGRDFLRRMTDAMVDDHIKNFDPTRTRDYVDAYLARMKEIKDRPYQRENYFTLDRLKANSVNMFIEGTESISFTIFCFLKELSKHTDVQRRIQDELDEVVGMERLPSWKDRTQLLYVESVLQELYRVATPFHSSAIYSNYKETTIAGYKIPKRSHIIASFWAINNDPTIYPHPEVFDPERFLKKADKTQIDGHYPFGMGKRSCLGEALARMEVFLFITGILQTFSISLGDTEGFLKLTSRTLNKLT